jgi:hypothetical protein
MKAALIELAAGSAATSRSSDRRRVSDERGYEVTDLLQQTVSRGLWHGRSSKNAVNVREDLQRSSEEMEELPEASIS